jgi:hypothetical protein
MRNSLRKFFLILVAMVCLASANAMAQILEGVGFRAGYTDDDPKQFHVGGHIRTKEFLRVITFRPNVECGFGRSAQLYSGNAEFAVRYINYGSGWSGYVGGGPSINVHKIQSATVLIDPGTRIGVNLMMGVDSSAGIFMEAKVGIRDSPTYKATFGYTFPIRR